MSLIKRNRIRRWKTYASNWLLMSALIVPTLAAAGNKYAPSTYEYHPQAKSQVAIIIDDIGYRLDSGLKAARFPAPLTLAILPFSPNGRKLAALGFLEGKTIMMHVPMSNIQQTQLEPGGLTEQMDKATLISALRNSLTTIPYVTGINNHMGSRLTQLPQTMNWVMEELKQQDLFFIDSRTTADSCAWSAAQKHQLPTNKRDVFLDNERSPEAINKQLDQLILLARKNGSAVAIGHPYPETMAALKERIPQLNRQGITLVPIDQLLVTVTPQQAAAAQCLEGVTETTDIVRDDAPSATLRPQYAAQPLAPIQ
jgi:polysaccharide deacetylase 2 family uncharacterized protein YibQ